jgi:tetratricopeptide (TPR) repeat protein
MKTLYLFSVLFIVLTAGCENSKENAEIAYAETTLQFNVNDTILENIQDKIYQAFVTAVTSKSVDSIETIESKLEALVKKHPQNIIKYWQAYLYYYKAVYYMQNKDKPNSEKAINIGVKIMEDLKPKNAEDYALLGMVQGFAIQYVPNLRKGVYSVKTKKNIGKALKLDSENIRAHYVAASNDFYTPKEFGGGKVMKEHLLKAIALPEQSHKNKYLPSWGKDSSYVMLIEALIKEDNKTEAKKYFKEAIALYPDDYSIKSLAVKLID